MTRDARYDILFEPVKIGPVTAKNRFFQVPHCNGMGYRDATSNAVMREIKAEGGWGVISTEQTEIHPTGDISPYIELRLWDDQDVSDSGTLQAVRDLTVAGAMLNGVVDFPLSDRLSIYAGAGLGVAWLDVGTTSDSLNDFDAEDGPFLAWQGRGGLTWSFTESTALQFGYRFLNIDDAQIEDGLSSSSFDLETQQHVLEIGLVFGF